VGVGIPSSVKSGSLALQGEMGASEFYGLVCVAPLRLRGLKGKKSTHNVGWEVPVKSHRLTRKSSTERAGQQLRASDLGYGTLPLFLHGRVLLYFTLLVMYFYLGKEND
jgi:hypothetical protein